MSADSRRLAVAVVASLREGTARALLRAFVRGRVEEGRRLLLRHPLVDDVDLRLADPVFVEWLLEALDLRISPPDPTEPSAPDEVDTEPYELDTSETRIA